MFGIQHVTPQAIIVVAAVGFVFLLIGYFLRKFLVELKNREAKSLSQNIIKEAEKEAENIKHEAAIGAREKQYKMKSDLERESKNKRNEIKNLERMLIVKEDNLLKKQEVLENKEKDLQKHQRGISEAEERTNKKEKNLNNLLTEELAKLEKISGMTSDEAKSEIKVQLLQEARNDANTQLKEIEDKTKETANEKSRWIISQAIEKIASDHVSETTISIVDLPGDDMKGRIIGREGRNIRALEQATGIDLIIDDTPEAVILSGFDPIRREVAKIALERLIADGRIHPGRIEEIVNKAKKEMDTKIRELGERAVQEVGIDSMHLEELKLLGRLKYRTSYSQNVLLHSKEVAFLCGIMAAELGMDQKLAKRAGLLHDLGKAIDHQTDGTHTQIGADIARRYNEHKIVINAMASHHEDVEPISPISILVAAADTLSASRPGARREMLESYVKRLSKLEEIGDSFKGVEKTFAIQAGREVRVIVESGALNDSDSNFLAKDIAKKIEKEMTYPGEVKVTVIRETRAVEFAR
tara:strand:+ start:10111 stop:11688 length:1578 start_codon:yes stop_codon:yes gene_type:complete